MVDVQTIGVLVIPTSVTIAAIYYTITLRTSQKNMRATLETRQAQLFMQMYERWSDAVFHEAATDIHKHKLGRLY